MTPKGNYAVMAQRKDPVDSLDYFPTPPWATRALCEHVLTEADWRGESEAWDPAAGAGHMAIPLMEYFGAVHCSDIHDYGFRGSRVEDFRTAAAALDPGTYCGIDWIITNPPFNLAIDFALNALRIACYGVALLTRTAWLEGGKRHDELFSKHPPHTVALFAERVPMVKGRWDPKASTATSYCWVIWRNGYQGDTVLRWIPPGRKAALTKPDDIERFGG